MKADQDTSTGTVHRTIRVIAAIAASKQDVGVGEVATKLGLPVPTIHRLLNLLRLEGVVDWDERTHRYAPGPELYRIAAQVNVAASWIKIATTELRRTKELTGETILLGLYHPGALAMSFEVRIEGDHPLQYRVEMHAALSLVWGASGKVILANLPEGIVKKALKAETKNAANGQQPPRYAQLKEELERILAAGFALSNGEKLIGARGIAAPVFRPNGIIGSVCMTSPTERIPAEKIKEFGQIMVECGRRISHSLGADLEGAI
jgi:DNA-binding IclR family transcriptional regulator